LLGNGDGTFQPHVDYTVGLAPFQVASGDVNEDGKPDLATSNINDNTVSILLGNGDGTFQPQMQFFAGSQPDWVVIADFNNDGKPDLGVADGAPSGAGSILLGNGDGTFRAPLTYPSATFPFRGTAGDFDRDGSLDMVLATANNAVSVLLQTTLALSNTTVLFLNQPVGTTSPPQSLILTNLGATSIRIRSATSSDSHFALTSLCPATLPAGRSCALQVTFTPTATGPDHG
jgi:hypothetical protein